MDRPRSSLMDVHNALSHLSFAVHEALRPLNVAVTIKWDQYVHLCVEVECHERDKQVVIDRLRHGALSGPYDYRFQVSFQTGALQPYDWVSVRAYPNMVHDDNLHKAARAT